MTFLDAALETWNMHKRPTWRHHKTLTPRMQGQLKKLRKQYDNDEDAIDAFKQVLAYAGKQRWARDAKLTLANLGSHDKFLEYAEIVEMENRPPPRPDIGRVRVLSTYPATLLAWRGNHAQVRFEDGRLAWLPGQDVEMMP